MMKITARIDGMMCSMCESHVSDAIRRAFPVKKVTASHKKGSAEILTETDIADADLRSALEPTGYILLSAEHAPYQKKGLFHR